MSFSVDLNNIRQDSVVDQDSGLNPENTVGFETWMPPRKRAKTKEEKEIRKIQRILRNRKAAQKSRDRKRNYVVTLEKKCNVMKQILDELQYKIDIKSLLSDKGMWNNYLDLEKETDLSSTPAPSTSSTTGNTSSTSTIAASWAAEVEATRGKDSKVNNRKGSFGEKNQVRVKAEERGIHSTPVRSSEQMTPMTSSYSAQSISPYVSSSDCESDGSKKSVVEATPVSLATSTPTKYEFSKPTQGQAVSQALMQGLFNPSEWQPNHLNNEGYQPFLLSELENSKSSEESFDINNHYEFDHPYPQINALHQPNHSINSLFVEDIGRNPEEITDLAMDVSTYDSSELLCTHNELDLDYELNLKMESDDFLL